MDVWYWVVSWKGCISKSNTNIIQRSHSKILIMLAAAPQGMCLNKPYYTRVYVCVSTWRGYSDNKQKTPRQIRNPWKSAVGTTSEERRQSKTQGIVVCCWTDIKIQSCSVAGLSLSWYVFCHTYVIILAYGYFLIETSYLTFVFPSFCSFHCSTLPSVIVFF